MTEPWFDPNRYAWVFGTALGVLGGTLGSLAGSLAPRGKAKPLIMGLFVGLVVGFFGANWMNSQQWSEIFWLIALMPAAGVAAWMVLSRGQATAPVAVPVKA